MFDFYFNLILYFVVGAIIGSFLSVVIARFSTGEGVVLGRSRCPQCKKTLTALELVPILSFALLRGRCRGCQHKISPIYPSLEIITGLLFAGLFFRFSSVMDGYNLAVFLFIYCLAMASLVVIFFIDARTYIIPDKIVLPGIAVALIAAVINLAMNSSLGTDFMVYAPNISQLILGPVFGGGFFLILVLISKESWMGWGDVKLGAFLGLLAGASLTVVALFFAFITGSIISLALIFLNKKTKKDIIPFAPFLVLGFLIAVFFGKFILQWYLGV